MQPDSRPLPQRTPARRKATKATGIAVLDGRTYEGRLARQLREGFRAQIGTPNPVEAALIDRAVMLSLQIARLDAGAAENGGQFEKWQSDIYLAWSNSLVRTLAQLGLAPKMSKAKRAAGGYDHSLFMERFATSDADAAA